MFLLERVADPLWRGAHIHPLATTDVPTYKPGNLSERAAAIVRGESVFVCALFQHDEYMRFDRKQADYQWSDFAPWVRPVSPTAAPETEGDLLQSARDEVRRLQGEVEDLNRAFTGFAEDEARARRQIAELEAALLAERARVQRLMESAAAADHAPSAASAVWLRRAVSALRRALGGGAR